MNAEQFDQVTSSFERNGPIAADAAELFYKQLFFLGASLRPLFKGDLSRPGRMLMPTPSSAVSGLTLLESLAPVLRQMGARHAEYGVKKVHYAAVGTALFWTLEQGLGYYYFTPDVRWAWAAAFELLSSTMQAGAAETS